MALSDLRGLKAQIQNVAGNYHDLVAERERLLQQRDETNAAACSREDMLTALCRLIDARAQQYPACLQKRIEDMGLAHNLDEVYHLAADLDRRGAAVGLLAAPQHTSVTPHWKHFEEALYFLAGDTIKDAVKRALFAMEWPAGALSLGERQKRLTDLDERIAVVEQQQSELFQAAREMGIRL